MSRENLNPLENAQGQIKKACEILKLEQAVYELLKEPQRVIEISIPVRMDNGEIRIFKGYRSLYNDAVGPGKGGVRFHQDVNMDEVKALSIWMTIKCCITGIPFGGGKGGVIVNPGELSQGELERLSRGYIRGIYKYIGENIDIPEPDVGTNSQIMAWMLDEYIKLTGEFKLGAITGKPVEWGGSLGRVESTGFGVSIITKEMCKKIGLDLNGASVIIQGFGNVGHAAVKYIQELGGKVIGIAEWEPKEGTYAIYNEDGLDFDDLYNHFYTKGNRNFRNYDKAQVISFEKFWEIDADILIPASLENAITEEIANKLKVKLICEGANGPVTTEADKILEARGINVSPDVLTNAGGVTVSHFEWVQNRYGYSWSKEEVNSKLEKSMIEAFKNVWAIKEEYNINLRQAAYVHSVKKIAEIMKLRGWY